MTRAPLALLVALAALVWSARALAAGGLEVRPSTGSAPARMELGDRGYQAELVVKNTGATAVRVVDVRPREAADDAPRLPVGVKATFSDGRVSGAIAPGQSRKVLVRWSPGPRPALRELYGHVVVETDEGERAVVGVHAEPASLFWSHVLSWLILIPLAGAVVIVAMRFFANGAIKRARWVAMAASLLQLLLAVWLSSRFGRTVSRLDGNDGYQFIERGALLPSYGVEYSLGIDGLSMPLVLMAALVTVCACLASRNGTVGRLASMLLASSAVTGAFVSLDVVLVLAFGIVLTIALVVLVAGGDGKHRRTAAKLGSSLGLGWLLFAFVAWYLGTHAGGARLVDGAESTRVFSIPELTRIGFLERELVVAGRHGVAVLWTCLLGAVLLLGGIPPLHTWLADVLEDAPTGVGMLVAGTATQLGGYLFVRVGYGVLPAGTLWGSTTLGVVGAIGVLYAGLGALAQTDLRRFVAYASAAHMGFVLVGLSSLTPAGVQGAVTQLASHGVSAALLLAVVGMIHARVETTSSVELGGLAKQMPRLTVVVIVAFAASLGFVGTPGFIAQSLSVIGAAAQHPVVALLAAGGFGIAAVAHARQFCRAFLGEVSEAWQKSRFLEPHGGRFPDLRERELLAVLPLVVALVLGGAYPRVVTGLSDTSSVDYAAFVNPPGPLQFAATTPARSPRKS